MKLRLRRCCSLLWLLSLATCCSVRAAGRPAPVDDGRTAPWVAATAAPGSFPLVAAGRATPLVIDAHDAPVVAIAARDLAADLERVTGVAAVVRTERPTATDPAPAAVLIGTLGGSAAIDALVAAGKLDVAALRGSWETFLIATVEAPLPGVGCGLVIVGSDRRGTAFGVYELSQAIGVSPWHWWADVVPVKRAELHVAAGTRKFGPPSVQYRGIFINDEDWGLQPWAAQTFAPEEGGIGPKVYRKVFELLLRLKANTLWPAMHECSPPFNAFPENARLADEYAIVMGSSHAEPMLRNNVREWTAPKPDYNYVTNRDGVRAYWEERVKTNGRFENIYTLGMRGIHDSGIQGAKTDAERIAVLERVFADQRALLAQHVRPEVEQLPQMFCAYKEVLDLYRQGLRVPDDVTIVWPDDNFGYVRNFASPEEQKRSGGFGVYYHISYLGRPLAYLWLCTTPPALIWEEMTKAYDHGARKIWIVNVGDLKPAEIGTEFFLRLAWDVKRWGPDAQETFLEAWATREFGAEFSKLIAGQMGRYYALNSVRKPEHLQWWLPGEKPRLSPMAWSAFGNERWSLSERRPGAFAMNSDYNWSSLWHDAPEKAKRLARIVETDAFRQLVEIPINGANEAWSRFLLGEMAAVARAKGWIAGEWVASAASSDDRSISELRRYFDQEVAGGKWQHFFRPEPASDEWRSMRIASWKLPDAGSAQLFAEPRIVLEGEWKPADETQSPRMFRPVSAWQVQGRDGAELRYLEVYGDGVVVAKARVMRAPRWVRGEPMFRDLFPMGRRFAFSIDWSRAPKGDHVVAEIEFFDGKKTHLLALPISNPRSPSRRSLVGKFFELDSIVSIEPEHFASSVSRDGAGWSAIPGLGRTGNGSVAVFPTTMPSVPLERAATDAPRLDYAVHFVSAGEFTLQANLIPAHPVRGATLRFAVALDDGAPQLVELKFNDGSADWAQGVLNNTRVATAQLTVAAPGAHTLRVYGLEPGVVLDKLVLFRGELPPSYLGPPETRVLPLGR